MQTKGVVVASENWEQKNTLPLPAQFLMESGRVMARKDIGLQYRLISLWPINKWNVASSEFEKIGLGTILTHPTKPYTGFVKEGGARYFQAVYPNLAVAQACIGCHNSHPDSPKRDFKINDVMGGDCNQYSTEIDLTTMGVTSTPFGRRAKNQGLKRQGLGSLRTPEPGEV